jgi:hypothetical protein
VTKIGEYKVNLLREYWSILKKALTRVSGAYGELFDEKNQRSKISCQGPFKLYRYFVRKVVNALFFNSDKFEVVNTSFKTVGPIYFVLDNTHLSTVQDDAVSP